MIGQVVLNGFVLGATIALMAIGLTLIFSILRLVNFAHGEFYMLGAVIFFYLLARAHIEFVLAAIIAIVAIGLLGWLSQRFIFRRFHGNLIGGALAALGLLLIFQNVTWMVFGPKAQTIPPVVSGQVEIFGASITVERLVIAGISLGTILGLTWFVNRTRLGKSIRAVQQDSEAALTLGISVKAVAGLAVGIATGLAALSGVLLAPLFYVNPGIGYAPLTYSFIVIIVGGMGSIPGALIAGFIIGLQQSFTSTFWSAELSLAISFLLAILILIARPRGLMGHA